MLNKIKNTRFTIRLQHPKKKKKQNFPIENSTPLVQLKANLKPNVCTVKL